MRQNSSQAEGARPRHGREFLNTTMLTAPDEVGAKPALTSKGGVFLGAVGLLLAVLAAYFPAIGNGYVWDDDAYLTSNQLILAPDGLKRIWFSLDSPSQYFPLIFTVFRIEYALWGLNPAGYHLVNILLHALNACLVWVILRRLALPGAWLAAALFALHPVQVESVAWITERKNVLSTVFYLAALLSWLRFTEENGAGRRRAYGLALGFCWLALFSKTTTCTLPAAMLIVCWLRGERLIWKRIVEIIPFAVSGLMMGLLTIWWERYHQGTSGPEFALGVGQRVLIAGRAFWFYLWKLAWPTNLTFSYPRWTIETGDWRQWLWPVGVVVLGAVLWLRRQGPGRGPLAGFVFFLSTLAPLLGFIALYTFRYTFVADHYQYVACLGPLSLLAAALSRKWIRPFPDYGLRVALPLALLLVLGSLTWNQNRVYRDDETLWRDTIAKNPSSWMAQNNLGLALAARGQTAAAALHYEESLRLEPGNALALVNLGMEHRRKGDHAAAEAAYRRAIAINPGNRKAHLELGVLLLGQSRTAEARRSLLSVLGLDPEEAVREAGAGESAGAGRRDGQWNDPDQAQAHYYLGKIFLEQEDLEGAAEQFRSALRRRADFSNAHYWLGNIFLQQNHVEQAASEFQAALRIQPSFADAHYNLGVALHRAGKTAEALEHFTVAVRLNPNHAKAQNNLGAILHGQGRIEQAVEHYRISLAIVPDNAEARNNLGVALAARGSVVEAVAEYREALRIRPDYIQARKNLEQILKSPENER